MTYRSLVNNAIGDHARINLGDVNHYYGGLAVPAHTIQFSEEGDPPPKGLILSDLPSKTECFFGREAELACIGKYLQRTDPDEKGVALCGISGSGKTQVVLEYIEREKNSFSAILWIDASSEMSVEDSLASSAAHICRHFPVSNEQAPSRWVVLEWLRSTRYRNWLLVVDSVDDLVPNKSIIEQLGSISHGRLCFTSTHSGIARAARVQPIPIDKLDLSASQSLILWRAFDSSKEPDHEACEWARQVTRYLDRFPLALELAGILAHEGIVSVQSSPDVFEKQYRQLTKFRVDPGGWPWSRNDSLFGIFEALYKTVATENSLVCSLLTLCSIYSPWEIPVAFLRNIELDVYDPVDLCDDWRQLTELFHDQTVLNTAIYELHRRFLAKKKQGSNREILSISLHQAVCRWRLATIGDDKAVWIMNASSALAKYVRSCYSGKAPERVSFSMAQQFLSPSHRCLEAIQKHVPPESLRVSGIYAGQYFTVCSSIADIFFATGKYRIARHLFASALSYLREVKAIEVRLDDQFRLTRGLGISCQQTGDLSVAQKELQAALELADAFYGHMSDEVIELNSRLKSVRDRISTDLDHRKRALVAGTDGKQQDGESNDVPATSFPPRQRRKLSKEEWLRIFEAAEQENDETVVATVIDNGADINETSDYNDINSPLILAIELGIDWVVKILLEHGAHVKFNPGDDQKRSLSASLEVCKDRWEAMTAILDLLIEFGADLREFALEDEKRLWLQRAAETGNIKTVEMFVEEARADRARTQNIFNAAIGAAAFAGHQHIVYYLLGTGGDVNSRLEGAFKAFGTALIAAAAGGHEPVVKLLLAHGALINVRVEGAFGSALEAAAARNQKSIMELLLASGADVNMPSRDRGTSALMTAAMNSNEALVELLISHGADVNMKETSEDGKIESTALWEAILKRDVSMANLLLTHNADVNIKHMRRPGVEWTPLRLAVSTENASMANLLLRYGADIIYKELQNQHGLERSALVEAVLRANIEMVNLLLDNGADINLNFGGSTPTALIAAVKESNRAMVNLLLDKGADINLNVGGSMPTALGAAVKESNEAMVELLLDRGANIDGKGMKDRIKRRVRELTGRPPRSLDRDTTAIARQLIANNRARTRRDSA